MTAKVTTGGPAKFKQWSAGIFNSDLPDFQVKAHRKIHLQTINQMIKGTPVGNPDLWQSKPPPGYVGGRARSNWQSSVLVPKAGEPNGPNASQYSGIGETQEMNRSSIAGLKAYSRTFVTNNTPYIIVLNDGLRGKQHSYQAPLMWMETALDRVEAQFKRGGK